MTPKNFQASIAGTAFVAALLAALFLHAVPALLAGLLAFVLTRRLLSGLRRFQLPRHMLSHELLAAFVVGVLSLVVLGVVGAGVARLLGGESVHGLLLTLSETVKQSKQFLPEDWAAKLPESVIEMKELFADALQDHANTVAGVSGQALHSLVLTLIGWIAGVLAAVRNISQALETSTPQPAFAATWFYLWKRFGTAFEHVAFAQTKIAALNAAITGVVLLVLCPLVGWNIPFAKALVLVTLLCGLLPVVGNLISSTIIFILALGVSLSAAVAAVAFLLTIHKLEYFAAARIQGREIGAQAWELLIMLFTFESLFGPAGMVAAPVIYAFVKAELRDWNWVRNDLA